MNAEDLFRGARVRTKSDSEVRIAAAAVAETLNHATLFRRLETEYATPSGELRVLDLTISPVYGSEAQMLGAACVIEDQTEMVRMRARQELRGDMSAEMALELKSSVACISEYAHRLARYYDEESAKQLANDIAAEAQHLERKIGGFLAADKAVETGSSVN